LLEIAQSAFVFAQPASQERRAARARGDLKQQPCTGRNARAAAI
jgi:hypothetical protein